MISSMESRICWTSFIVCFPLALWFVENRIPTPRQKKRAFLRCLPAGSVEMAFAKTRERRRAGARVSASCRSLNLSTDLQGRLLQLASG